MVSKSDFFHGLNLRPRPESQLMTAIRMRTCNPNSLLSRPTLLPSSFSIENKPVENKTYSSSRNTLASQHSSINASGTRASLRSQNNALHTRLNNDTNQLTSTGDPADTSCTQLRSIRERIASRQLQNIVQIKRIFNASSPYNKSSDASAAKSAGKQAPHANESALVDSQIMLVGKSGGNSAVLSKHEAKLKEKRAKFLKHLCKLEFSSLLFRKTYLRISYLTNKTRYDQILEYEQYCGTSNKALIKQSLAKTQMFKCKTSRTRTRMLRSTEVVNGKITEQWQRSDYVHTYSFTKRQRLRRFYQIQKSLGYHQRVLRLSYGRLQIVLPKLEQCPSCKEKLNADQGHCCARRKLRSSKQSSSSSSSASVINNGRTISLGRMQMSDSTSGRSGNFHSHDCESFRDGNSSQQVDHQSFTESTTLMSIHQDKTEYYNYRADQLELRSSRCSVNDTDSDDISIIKVSSGLMIDSEQDASNGASGEGRTTRKCGSTLLLDSSNYKDSSPLVVKRVAYESELDQLKVNHRNEESKNDTIQLRRVKSNICSNRVQSKSITIAHENYSPLDKNIQIV